MGRLRSSLRSFIFSRERHRTCHLLARAIKTANEMAKNLRHAKRIVSPIIRVPHTRYVFVWSYSRVPDVPRALPRVFFFGAVETNESAIPSTSVRAPNGRRGIRAVPVGARDECDLISRRTRSQFDCVKFSVPSNFNWNR